MTPAAMRLCIVALACLSVGGCAWKGGSAGDGESQDGQTWSPQPTQIRVYPSSRFNQLPDGTVVLEARVELLDSMGDSTKAAGEYRVELLKQADERVPQRLYAWDVTVRTLAEQGRHYERVTRTYVFRLRLDSAAPPRQPMVVRVSFMPLAGEQRLTANLDLSP